MDRGTEALKLKQYQQSAVDFVINNSAAGLFIDMGLGKTAAVLSAIKYLLSDSAEISNVLVVAPKRVAEQTWPDEIDKWDSLRNLKYQVLSGTPAQRLQLMSQPSHIDIISRDLLSWLFDRPRAYRIKPYDMLVIDESTSFKTPSSVRFKALKAQLNRFKRVVIMTGTPAPNGLLDLWSQLYILDRGTRLGKTVTSYRSAYFNCTTYGGFPDYKLKPGADVAILDKCRDICMSLNAEDYLTLPDCLHQEITIQVPTDLAHSYKCFARDMVLALPDKQLTASSAGALAGKLLQYCGGNVYDDSHNATQIHTLKLEALDDIIEQASVQGEQVLVYYAYQSELEQLQQRYPKARTIKDKSAITRWLNHECPILLAHPASAGHGLNLQGGGHICVWYNLTYDLELYQQANKRLHRLGQTKPVMIYHLTLQGMADSHILNSVLAGKAKLAQAVMAALDINHKPDTIQPEGGDTP